MQEQLKYFLSIPAPYQKFRLSQKPELHRRRCAFAFQACSARCLMYGPCVLNPLLHVLQVYMYKPVCFDKWFVRFGRVLKTLSQNIQADVGEGSSYSEYVGSYGSTVWIPMFPEILYLPFSTYGEYCGILCCSQCLINSIFVVNLRSHMVQSNLFWIIPSVSSHGSVFTTGINLFAAVNLSRVGYLS